MKEKDCFFFYVKYIASENMGKGQEGKAIFVPKCTHYSWYFPSNLWLSFLVIYA